MTEVFSTRQHDETVVRIIIKRTNELSFRDPSNIQLLNIMNRTGYHDMGFKEINRNYFDAAAAQHIQRHRSEFLCVLTPHLPCHALFHELMSGYLIHSQWAGVYYGGRRTCPTKLITTERNTVIICWVKLS